MIYLLYAEYYLLILMLPYPLWPLCCILYLVLPSPIKLLKREGRLYMVMPDSEILSLGAIKFNHEYPYLTLTICQTNLFLTLKWPKVD